MRVSDIAQLGVKQQEFDMMKRVASLGVPMCMPIEFGVCEDSVYSVQSWIDGVDAEEVMKKLKDISKKHDFRYFTSVKNTIGCFKYL